MSKYSWKLKSFAKGIDPEEAIKEFERIESFYGKLTPEYILKESWQRDSVLHNAFIWDNNIAAEHFRLQQARNLLNNIQVNIVSDGEEHQISVYEIINGGEGRIYKNIITFTDDDIEFVKKTTIHNLEILKRKLSVYQNFKRVVKHLDIAIEIMKET